MTLQSSGPISIAQVGVEVGITSGTVSFSSSKLHALASSAAVSSTSVNIVSLSLFYGKSGHLSAEPCFTQNSGSPGFQLLGGLSDGAMFNLLATQLNSSNNGAAPLTLNFFSQAGVSNWTGQLSVKNNNTGVSATFTFAGMSGSTAVFTSNSAPANFILAGSTTYMIEPV